MDDATPGRPNMQAKEQPNRELNMRSRFLAPAVAAAALAFSSGVFAQWLDSPAQRPNDVHTQISDYESWLQSQRNLIAAGQDPALAGPPPHLPPEVRARISEDRHGPYAAYFYGGSPYQLQYRIGNWRSYGLPRPPARHDWYRTTDNHFALVNIASGTIAQLLASR